MASDGMGNLIASDPENPDVDGFPIAYHDGSYIFVQAGEPSHNQRHHQQYAVIDGTRDAESVKAAAEAVGIDPESEQAQAMINAGGGENMHHFETQEDDLHYDPDTPNHTTPNLLPDALAAVTTSHTDAARPE